MFPDSQVCFTECVWTEGVSGKKSIRIRMYPDMCGLGLNLLRIATNEIASFCIDNT